MNHKDFSLGIIKTWDPELRQLIGEEATKMLDIKDPYLLDTEELVNFFDILTDKSLEDNKK